MAAYTAFKEVDASGYIGINKNRDYSHLKSKGEGHMQYSHCR
ncbi:MAG: hypothetical protein Q8908_00495 [Bacteroidota bacterium]|nr:hypothetical protein [Bacteroidota bacterium]